MDFDRVLNELILSKQRYDGASADDYDLVQPPLFEKSTLLSHTCFTHFHKREGGEDEEDSEETERKKVEAAELFIEHLVQTEKLSALSQKTYRETEG